MLCDQFVEARLVEQSIALHLLKGGANAKVQEVIQILETQTGGSNFVSNLTMMADSTVAI